MLHVALPEGYGSRAEPYPMLVCLDAQWTLGTVCDAALNLGLARLLPRVIVVGVGWAAHTAREVVHARARDFTPTVGALPAAVVRDVGDRGQVRREADLNDDHGLIRLRCQHLAKEPCCEREPCLIVRIAEPILVTNVDHREVLAVLPGPTGTHCPDGNAATTVERVDEINKRRRPGVIDADGDGQQPGITARLHCVDHAECKHIVHVTTHIGIEDEPHRIVCSYRQPRHEQEQNPHERY